MNRDNMNRPAAYSQGILEELEAAKHALHAVDGNIKGILSKTPAATVTEGDIPVLDDVVDDRAAESSADAQLSLTNRYKTLSEWDLEKAAAASAAAAAEFEPPLQAGSEEQELMLQLDELLIDDDLDVTFDLDRELGLDNSQQRIGVTPASPEANGGSASPAEAPPSTPTDSILPDIDRLNAELGVEPLPSAATTAGQSLAALQSPKADTESLSPPPTDAQPSIPKFGITSSTHFGIADNGRFGSSPVRFPAAPLEPEQLKQLIECALETQIPALKQSLFEHLESLLYQHPSPHS